VFVVPPGLREDFALYVADVVNPGSGGVARIELTPDQEQGPIRDRQ
jgi:hypothetical protein